MTPLLAIYVACFGIRAPHAAAQPIALLAVAPNTAQQFVAATPAASDAGKPDPRKDLKPGVVGTPEPVKPILAPDVAALIERMQAFYEKTKDFRAAFRQDYTYKSFKKTQTSTGKVVFKKPALMRWEYETPAPKTFVLASDKVYVHDPDAMTLTKANAGTDKLSASVTFLWGKGKLTDEFYAAKKECKSCKGTLLELTPLRPDPRFQKVLFEVDPASAQVMKSIVIDPDGSENAISFTSLELNTGVEDAFFKLAPPAGTQMVDLTGAGGGTAPK